jgi:phosphopantetheinyl transferase
MFNALRKGAVDIYHLRLEPESCRAVEADGFLDEEELAYYHRCSNIRRKSHFLYGRALVKSMIAWQSGLPRAAVRLKQDPDQRLYWDSPFPDQGSGTMDFNLSHAGALVACAAILDGKVGIDVESMERDMYHTGLSFFHDREKEYLSSQREQNRRQAACRLWTLKESYVKCKGRGFAIPFESFTVLERKDVFFATFRVAHYFISVTVESENKNIKKRIKEVNLNTLLEITE